MLHFHPPTPEDTARVLDACTDPALTLRDIAQQNNTTVEALSLWLSSPEVAERFDALHSINAVRTRFLAAAQLPRAIDALSEVLTHAKSILRAAHSPTPASSSSTSDIRHPTSALLQARLLETTRRAATTIIALTRWSPVALNSVARASSPCSSSSLSSPPLPPWRERCPSEAMVVGVERPDVPDTTTVPAAPTSSPLAIPNIFATLFASPHAPATPAPAPITPPPIPAALDSITTTESSLEAPATPAALIANFLAELSKLPIPIPATPPDRPPLTPEEAAYSPGPGHPTLGQLETLTAYLDSIHADLGLADEPQPSDYAPLLTSIASHEHWP